ncbi:c-type cytochrome biogenesis protein CcsB [Nocardioides marmoraquaticus]
MLVLAIHRARASSLRLLVASATRSTPRAGHEEDVLARSHGTRAASEDRTGTGNALPRSAAPTTPRDDLSTTDRTTPTATGKLDGAGHGLLGLGVVLLLLAITTRGIAAGRVPWSNMYEFAVVGTLTTVAAYLLLASRPNTRPVRLVGVWVATAAALFLGLAITVLYTPAAGLIPVLDSAWLVIHVAAAIIAGGLFTVGALVSVLYLISVRRAARTPGRARGWPSETFDQIAQTAYTIAFPIWTFAVIAGAIWAENSWGRYWGWDPKETWAFITWVLYAAYLHAQATGGWRGKKATWLALAGYVAFLFNFVGVNMWVGGLHSYSGL